MLNFYGVPAIVVENRVITLNQNLQMVIDGEVVPTDLILEYMDTGTLEFHYKKFTYTTIMKTNFFLVKQKDKVVCGIKLDCEGNISEQSAMLTKAQMVVFESMAKVASGGLSLNGEVIGNKNQDLSNLSFSSQNKGN
ncbi:hypothetical protein SHAb15599_00049 [Acinetobacter phage SH-Ab 15599]|nr:hypothetical protein SHAb15599_00049 [Acinetobacter phage SH-Ab 15599]